MVLLKTIICTLVWTLGGFGAVVGLFMICIATFFIAKFILGE